MSVWLTRLVLDTRHRAVRADLRDAVNLHKRVMMLVPDDLGAHARARTGVLFRLEEGRSGLSLLIQSQCRPELDRLPDGYGTAAVKDIDPLLTRLRPGLPVHYRIAANASKRLAKADGNHKAKQVVALSGSAADEWWSRKATEHGLALSSLLSTPMPTATGKAGQGQRVSHSLTRFDGLAVITDAERLRAAIVEGIGRGKSYGCGLLSLAVART
ncbi:type I-E CRISPR-associated protein Cas6/Cse3/CasE [Actinomadura sp. DC4]|uniref:type I-E CRISPR-associated protein Cas6/Cse3/CasE n=1 Tax=Actinomadura sp. DC4 TaxID=3055069 RepID=UPI0025B0D475|nr:type I-E CRISPR-associated protein Cas6/Cse3/CasE [Actinomadura sp. DC4]MDN3355840.1 type I-E CRISPR-associated protein Cas6/Cse3/CasE [Actinomadura sp. DC4]